MADENIQSLELDIAMLRSVYSRNIWYQETSLETVSQIAGGKNGEK